MYHVHRAVSKPSGHTIGGDEVGVGAGGGGPEEIGADVVGGVGDVGGAGRDPEKGKTTCGSPFGSLQVSGIPS